MSTLFRYREISLQSNARYLNALAQVDDPSTGVHVLDSLTTRKKTAAARPANPFHPLSRPETQLFAALMRANALHGFTNHDLSNRLDPAAFRLDDDPRKRNAQISRLLHGLHVCRLIAKIPRCRRSRSPTSAGAS